VSSSAYGAIALRSPFLIAEKISRRASFTASSSSCFGGGRRMMRTSDRGIELLGVRSVLGSGATSPFTARVTPPELRIVTIFLARRADAIVTRAVGTVKQSMCYLANRHAARK
jgi:hypothetical protein